MFLQQTSVQEQACDVVAATCACKNERCLAVLVCKARVVGSHVGVCTLVQQLPHLQHLTDAAATATLCQNDSNSVAFHEIERARLEDLIDVNGWALLHCLDQATHLLGVRARGGGKKGHKHADDD